jgi:hypothetical protein
MTHQPPKNSRGKIRDLKKSNQSKSKSRRKLAIGERNSLTEREISEFTLRRLHTLGSQKFGSSPYSQHFERWLSNIESVLVEFELNLNIGIDDQFVIECSEILSTIRQQLENRRRRESTIDQEIKYLSECRSQLQQMNADYVTAEKARRSQKNRTVKRLNNEISCLRKEQDDVIRIKTGFLRGISKKEREQKELEIIQEINAKQTELELLILNFSSGQKMFREELETKRRPVLEQIKRFRKMIRDLEIDGSLEERWFACEALIDSVNIFLQRKAAKSNDA